MATELSAAGRGTGWERFGAQLRDLQERLRRLENRRTFSIGAWRLTEDPDNGNLIATNSQTSQVTIIAVKS